MEVRSRAYSLSQGTVTKTRGKPKKSGTTGRAVVKEDNEEGE
jgi:hypothetical protein